MSERKGRWLPPFLSRSAQVFTDDDDVWEDENDTARNHCTNLLFAKGSHIHVVRPSLMQLWPSRQSHGTRWVCVQRGLHTGVHARHIQLLACTSLSSLISSRHVLSYATSQEKSETNTTKVDERWNCSVHLSWNPAVDSLTVEWLQQHSSFEWLLVLSEHKARMYLI